jgi:hypothetical protein
MAWLYNATAFLLIFEGSYWANRQLAKDNRQIKTHDDFWRILIVDRISASKTKLFNFYW